MRKRNVQILFRLTEEEAEHLNELVRKSGRSKEAFLREMVRGYQLCEKPDPEFYKMMRELSAITMTCVEADTFCEYQSETRATSLLPHGASGYPQSRVRLP